MRCVDWKQRELEGFRAILRSEAYAKQLRRGFERSLKARSRGQVRKAD